MIDNLKISYVQDRDISVTLSTETGYDPNLPFNLAADDVHAVPLVIGPYGTGHDPFDIQAL